MLHCKRRVDHHTSNHAICTSSIRFKFNLTCKAKYEENEEFKTQRILANNILMETKKSMRDCMVSVMKMEKDGAIAKLQFFL